MQYFKMAVTISLVNIQTYNNFTTVYDVVSTDLTWFQTFTAT